MHLQTDSGMAKTKKRVRIDIIGVTGIGVAMIGAVIAHGGTILTRIRIRIHIHIYIHVLALVHVIIVKITMKTGMMTGGHLADRRTNVVVVLRIFNHERTF